MIHKSQDLQTYVIAEYVRKPFRFIFFFISRIFCCHSHNTHLPDKLFPIVVAVLNKKD